MSFESLQLVHKLWSLRKASAGEDWDVPGRPFSELNWSSVIMAKGYKTEVSEFMTLSS